MELVQYFFGELGYYSSLSNSVLKKNTFHFIVGMLSAAVISKSS